MLKKSFENADKYIVSDICIRSKSKKIMGINVNQGINPFAKKDEQKVGSSVSEKQAASEIVLYGENATPVQKAPANKGDNIGLVSQEALSADDNMGLGIERTTTNTPAGMSKPTTTSTQKQDSTYTNLDSYLVGETASRVGATVEDIASSAIKNAKLSKATKIGGKALGYAGSIIDTSLVVKDVADGKISVEDGAIEVGYIATDTALGAVPVVGSTLSFIGSKNIKEEYVEKFNEIVDDYKKGDYGNLASRTGAMILDGVTGGPVRDIFIGAAGRKISSMIGDYNEKAGEVVGKYMDLYGKSMGGDINAAKELSTMAVNDAKEVVKSTTETAKKVVKNTAKAVLPDETYKTASQTYKSAKKEVKEGNYADATKTVVKGVAKAVLPDKAYDTMKDAYKTVKNWF